MKRKPDEVLYERRHPVKCERCNTEMAFAKVIKLVRRTEDVHVKYICPTREDESGCGVSTWIAFEKTLPDPARLA